SGIKLRETDEDLLLRNAEDQTFNIPLDSIDERTDGGSLMPTGLVDTLTRVELTNLVRYLSELGKLGEYALPREKFVRSWETFSIPKLHRGKLEPFEIDVPLFKDSQSWTRKYSAINGGLPTADLPTFDANGKEFSGVRFSVDNSNPNAIIHVTPIAGLRIWKNGEEVESLSDIRLSQSGNEFELVIDRDAGIERIFVEIK
ncbi:hypothetical protein ACFL2H_06395, partial [Planctomycetota bacterium]